MKSILNLSAAILGLLLVIPAVLSANPAPPREHPAYLHALTDLRHARAHLERPGGAELKEQERRAIQEIDAAIFEIRKASIEDGKNLNDHPPVDAGMPWPGRLHRALELLDKARHDVSEEEDNGFAQGLQARAIEHIEKAHHHTEEALHLVE
jgi:hypothetical protein